MKNDILEITRNRFDELVEIESMVKSEAAIIVIIEDNNGKKTYNLKNTPEDMLPVTRSLLKEVDLLQKEIDRLRGENSVHKLISKQVVEKTIEKPVEVKKEKKKKFSFFR